MGSSTQERDLKAMYSRGLINKREYEETLKALRSTIRTNPYDARIGGYLGITPHTIVHDEFAYISENPEIELVKNIIVNALKTKLGAIQSYDRDGYEISFKFLMPREFIVQGSTIPVLDRLRALKNKIGKVIDGAIEEIKERNGK